MSARLSRAQREALERQDAPWLSQPLHARSMAAHLRHMVKLLRNKRAASPCSDAAAYLHALFDRTLAEAVPAASQQRVACKEGCMHCCLQPVGLTAAEAFHVARQIRTREATVAAIRDAGRRIAALPRTQRLYNSRCLMLAENLCSIHPSRPLACRSFMSFDVNACFAKFVMLGNVDIRGPEKHAAVIDSCRMLLYASFGLIGRRDFTAGYEMKAALAAVLEMDEDAEARWLKGEDVMAGVDLLPGVQPIFAWDIGRLMNEVGPTL